MCLGFGKFKPSFGGGNDAKVFPPVSKEASFGTNGSSILPSQCSSEAPVAPSIFLPESLLNKGKNADAAPGTRLQPTI